MRGECNIAKAVPLVIAKGSCNTIAALQADLAILLRHYERILQWFRATAKGSRNGFAALRVVSAMAPVNVRQCNDVFAKQKLLLGILGPNCVTCLGVRGKRRNVLHCLVNNGFHLRFDRGLGDDLDFVFLLLPQMALPEKLY